MSLNWHNIKSTLSDYLHAVPKIGLRAVANIVPAGSHARWFFDWDNLENNRLGRAIGAMGVYLVTYGEIPYVVGLANLAAGSNAVLNPTDAIDAVAVGLALKLFVNVAGSLGDAHNEQVSGRAPPLAQQDGIEAVVADGQAFNPETKVAAS